MRKTKRTILTLLLVTLVGSLLSGSALAKEIGTGGKVKLDGATVQYTTEMSLRESLTPSDPGSWTPVYGNLENGYTMVLSGTVGETVYLDVASISPAPAIGDYPFYLDPVRVPANFWSYWANHGVVAGASGWQAVMWQIINGDLPIFYLRVTSAGSHLIDGLAWQTQGLEMPARVSADYPLHTYNFEGLVGTENVVVGITYTREVTPSLRIGDVEPLEIVIDGCGYVDVTIHLENVYNLYALDLSLTFDQTLVEVVDQLTNEIANPGVNLLPIAPWGNPATAYTVRNLADNSAGTIRFVASLLNTQAPITGGLDVATIRLRAKGLGESKLTITGMTLSDRDGYLVGVPLTTAVEYPVITQFTAAGGLDLGIIRLNPTTVQLNWSKQTMDAGVLYKLYRSTLPYFEIGDPGVVPYTTGFSVGVDTVTFDDQVLGRVGPTNPAVPEPNNNYFYAYGLQVVCSNGFTSPLSDQVGKIEYELLETQTTDFNWVGLVLVTEPNWTNAAALAQHIQNNSINEFGYPVSVASVSKWLPEGQTLSVSTLKPFPINNFDVYIRSAYRIVIDIAPVNPTLTQGSIIWAQVGRLPIIESDTYTLWETATTSLNWILQPLDKTGITKAAGLASDVSAHSSAAVSVSAVSNFLASGQSLSTFSTSLPFINNFWTRFGYPYRIAINVTYDADNPVTYPRY